MPTLASPPRHQQPGEVFVHRNVGKLVVPGDVNCLSVLQYGIEVLGVRHVIVCGHYGCGGIRAALQPRPFGALDVWLRQLRELRRAHQNQLEDIVDEGQREDRLCELNVISQVANVCRTGIVQAAWRRRQPLSVHGWIYSVGNGVLHDLGITVEGADQMAATFSHPGA